MEGYLSKTKYDELYEQSIHNPETFWANQADRFVSWIKPWSSVLTGSFATHDTRWYEGGQLNACYNCLDRHLEKRANQTAIIWQGDELSHSKHITCSELHRSVCQFANVLKKRGVKKGDRVCIYMPMIPEAAIAMLACARIGAIHSVVFGGFSPESLKNRILDADCTVLITANEGVRGGKIIPLKNNCDEALADCPNVHSVIVIKRTGAPINWNENQDIWYHEAIESVSADCPIEVMEANDPLFILYTSGSTGKPKGVLHSTGGYLVYAAVTHQYIFDYQDSDIYWCTADIGWITGHSYIIYGPLTNGATTLMFEGIPTFPDASCYWRVVDKHEVTIFYTAPTAIRALMREGDSFVEKTNRNSLRILGTVGEPINPDVWQWYSDIVGEGNCQIVDTWWQTETGGIMISPIPYVTKLKPGSVTRPFLGIVVDVVDDKGKSLPHNKSGKLVITKPWPGMMQTIYGDHQRFIDTYFKEFPDRYVASDAAFCDEDGDYWIIGRTDDVINVSGHRLGTAEVESALLHNHHVAEAAVVGYPHDIKGQGIYAFVVTKTNVRPSDELKQDLIKTVREVIGPIAKPDVITWATSLPKTRSGKIMRRILRQIAAGDIKDLGDTSTLANPEVVEELITEAEEAA